MTRPPVWRGRARRLGDDVNTDYIISSTRKRDTLDEQLLTRWLLETVDPAFAASVRAGDLIVAGRNFGCGSAMEIAATVILAAGIPAVLARSFSRTFFRNAVNNGLMPIECDTSAIAEGDELLIAPTAGGPDAALLVRNERTAQAVAAAPITGIMAEILESGGLVPYIRTRGRFGAATARAGDPG